MRFMHIADVHLGAAPDHGYPWAKARGKELWEGFRRCIADANEKKVDLLLIAGDLFDRRPEIKELNEVNYLFSTLEKTVVVLIAGNRDYLEPSSPYLTYQWNENVIKIFSGQLFPCQLSGRFQIQGFRSIHFIHHLHQYFSYFISRHLFLFPPLVFPHLLHVCSPPSP